MLFRTGVVAKGSQANREGSIHCRGRLGRANVGKSQRGLLRAGKNRIGWERTVQERTTLDTDS